MHPQSAIAHFAEAVGGNLPIFGHAAEGHTFAQFANIGLAAMTIAIVGSYHIGKHIAAVDGEFGHTISGVLGLEFGGHFFKTVHYRLAHIVEHRGGVEAINIEQFAAVAVVVGGAEHHFHDGCKAEPGFGFGIERSEHHVGVAFKAAFKGVGTLVGMPAIAKGRTSTSHIITDSHHITFGLLASDVAHHIKIVGALQLVAFRKGGDKR